MLTRNNDFFSSGVPTLWQEDLLAEANETHEVAQYIMSPTRNPDDVDETTPPALQVAALAVGKECLIDQASISSNLSFLDVEADYEADNGTVEMI